MSYDMSIAMIDRVDGEAERERPRDGVLRRESEPRCFVVFAFASFSYILVVSLLVQFLILPRLFPEWHAGNGLIAGGDMPGYHALAVSQAERIDEEGWSAWTLRPGGQAPAGLASALYVLLTPEPWTMIPFYALLHAAAGVLLAAILLQFFSHPREAILASLPLVLFPSAASWYSQLGKDAFSIAGYLAIVLGWFLLIRLRKKPRRRHFVFALGLILAGTVLDWVVRPYLVEIIWGFSGIAALMVSVSLAFRYARRDLALGSTLAGAGFAWFAFAAMGMLATGRYEPESPPSRLEQIAQTELGAATKEADSDSIATPVQPRRRRTVTWTISAWLPSFIDGRLYSLAVARNGFTSQYPTATSNIDEHVEFRSVGDMIEYVPRALGIALIYPTPREWLSEGSLPQNTFMRRISGLEMSGVYLALCILPLAIWRWKARLELWILLLLCLGMMTVHALVVANLGTLYRMRYPYLMTLVGLGLLGGLAWLADRKKRASLRADQQALR